MRPGTLTRHAGGPEVLRTAFPRPGMGRVHGPCFSWEPRCSIRPMTEEEEPRIRQLIERLVMRFPQLPATTVENEVRSVHQGFEGAPLREFVPLLVEHDVVIVLKVLAGRADLSPEHHGPLGVKLRD